MAITTYTSIRKSGSTRLSGDVTLSAGAGATLTQSGNDIQIGTSSAAGDSISKSFNQVAHGLSVGNAVELNGSGAWIKADASDVTKLAIGIVSTVTDVDNVTIMFAGYISGLSGLTTGEYHYVSASTPGALTPTEPASPNYSNPILMALSTTTGIVIPYRPSTPVQASSYAPVASNYVTIGNDSSLTNERALTGTTNQVTVTDGGAGGNVTLSLPQSIATSSNVTFAGVTSTGGQTFTGSHKRNRTTVADTAYTMLSTDSVIAYTSLTAARTVTLLAAATAGAGARIQIIDESGSAGEFNIIVDANGTEKIDGVLSWIIQNDYGTLELESNGTNWFAVTKPNPVTIINRDFTNQVVVSTAAETTVYTFTLPANTLRKNRGLRFTMMGHLLNNTGSNRTIQLRYKIGSQTVGDHTHTAASNANERAISFTSFVQEDAVTNSQAGITHSMLGAVNTVAGVGAAVAETFLSHHHTLAQDGTTDLTVTLTVQLSISSGSLQATVHTIVLEYI